MYCSPVRMRWIAATSLSWPVVGTLFGSIPAAFIAAMKSAGIDPSSKPVTGGDSEAAAIQRILIGEQYSTIYLAIKQQAETSAQLAVAAAQGKSDPEGVAKAKVDNGAKQVPSVLLSPIAVTKDNIKDTIIADGFLKPADICTGKYASACKEAGLE